MKLRSTIYLHHEHEHHAFNDVDDALNELIRIFRVSHSNEQYLQLVYEHLTDDDLDSLFALHIQTQGT